MSAKNKIIILCAISLIIIFVLIGIVCYKKYYYENTIAYKEEQLRAKEELEPLLEEVREVMRGERIAEGIVGIYNIRPETYKDIVYINADVAVIYADLQEEEGSVIVTGYQHCCYENGETTSYATDTCQLWEVSRAENGEWEITDIPNYIGGDEYIEQAEKRLKKQKNMIRV